MSEPDDEPLVFRRVLPDGTEFIMGTPVRKETDAPAPAAPPPDDWDRVFGSDVPDVPLAEAAAPEAPTPKALAPSRRPPDPVVEGVTRRGNRWQAASIIDGKLQHLGMFATEEEAERVWRQKMRISARDGDRKWNQEPFTPSDEQRRMVADLAKWGLPQDKIRYHVINPITGQPVSDNTLRHYFADELTAGALKGDRDTVKSLHEQMVGRDAEFWRDENGEMKLDKTGKPIVLRQELRPSPAVAIFNSKTRPGVGLRETVTVEHTTSKANQLYERLKGLSLERLQELRDVLERADADIERAEGDGRPALPAASD